MIDRETIVFYTPEYKSTDDPVFHSQVIARAAVLSKLNYHCYIMYSGPDSCVECMSCRISLKMTKLRHSVNFIGGLLFSLYDAAILYNKLRKADFIYTRNINNILTISFIKFVTKFTHVHDVRGLAFSEYQLNKGGRLKYRLLKMYEKLMIQIPDRITTVSSVLAKWIQSNLKKTPVGVIPSCIVEYETHEGVHDNQNMLKIVNVSSDDIVILYVGGVSKWQCLDSIVEIMKRLSKREKRLKFVIATNHIFKLNCADINSNTAPDWMRIVNLSHRDVQHLMYISDYGVIYRQDNLMNRVSSPIKCAEYLFSGLPIICTKNIGDISDQITKRNLGVCISYDYEKAADEIYEFLHSKNIDKMSIKNAGKELFSYDSYKDTLKDIFVEN